ncbi:HAMP domain-containing protein [Reyranella sp. CPCC 100927]|uniref:HAMP domain-containing protein n=1 Tax=Reyranella sp. CPCC 100927 TaxID=2599616 RepID=UPI0011B50227|nr:HAMP domain-containing protein [Reyranella sp. CPCC 100927]TWT13828.1 HAMP domain-containing protein [Reyranella sp. CPCC 100927]
MSLRTKLMTSFAGLAAIALLVIAVAFYTTLRWQAAAAEMEMHFQRSLLLQSVRANTFQALKEVDDGLTGDHVDARADFEAALEPATRDFADWAARADTPAERDEVSRVRAIYEELVASGRRVFDLIPVDRAAAIRLVDDEVDTKDLARFREITAAAVEADLAIRGRIAAEMQRLRETAQVMLAISAISVIALTLLIAAYLSSDLFRPLRRIAAVLDRLANGDRDVRADTGRNDEIGVVARGVNQLANTIAAAHSMHERTTASAIGIALSARLAMMRERGASASDWKAVEAMAAAVDSPARTDTIDLVALFHALLARHQGELVRRGIAIEQRLAMPSLPKAANSQLVEAALEAMLVLALDRLPDHGGRLGMRAYRESDGSARIEVADNGGAGETDLGALEAIARDLGGSARRFADANGEVFQLSLA